MPASRREAEPLRRAVASFRTGDLAEAARWAAAAVKAAPGHFDALYLAGLVAARRGRYDEALALCDRALALRPDSADTLNCRGGALADLGRHAEALEAFDRALVLRPDHVQALNNRGNALKAFGRFDEAIADFDQALAGSPHSAVVLNNRGTVLSAMRRYAEALPWFERALQIDPDFAEAHANRGTALFMVRESALALDSLGRALQLKPDLVVALQTRGSVLATLGQHRAAADDLERGLKLAPKLRFAEGALLNARMACCDWRDCAELSRRVAEDVRNGQPRCVPFAFLGISDSSEDQLACARTWVREQCPPAPLALWTGERYRHERIRVAYLSADFREHATSTLAVGLFECHDRSRFDVTAISFGAATPGPMRARVTSAFETFIDVRRMDDHEVADRIRKREIDIAVDLDGFTRDCRTGILAHRPAPIQVNYLGYPGTMAAGYIDYMLADRRGHSTCGGLPLHGKGRVPARHLPAQRLAAAHRRANPNARGSRAAGDGLRLLLVQQQLQDHAGDVRRLDAAPAPGRGQRAVAAAEATRRSRDNLRREAEARGVAPERLVFAPRLAASRIIWRDTGSPICSSTRCPTTRTRRRAMRCGRDCRC